MAPQVSSTLASRPSKRTRRTQAARIVNLGTPPPLACRGRPVLRSGRRAHGDRHVDRCDEGGHPRRLPGRYRGHSLCLDGLNTPFAPPGPSDCSRCRFRPRRRHRCWQAALVVEAVLLVPAEARRQRRCHPDGGRRRRQAGAGQAGGQAGGQAAVQWRRSSRWRSGRRRTRFGCDGRGRRGGARSTGRPWRRRSHWRVCLPDRTSAAQPSPGAPLALRSAGSSRPDVAAKL
jgi:hypothetical protein